MTEPDAQGLEWINDGLWLMEESKASVCKHRDLKDKHSRGLQSGCNYTGPGLVTSPSLPSYSCHVPSTVFLSGANTHFVATVPLLVESDTGIVTSQRRLYLSEGI